MPQRLLLLFLAFCMLGFSETKTYTLKGTIQTVNEFAQTVTVRQERIAGYAEARVMTYKVHDPAILEKLGEGDRIVATIRENDATLYDVRVVRIDDRSPSPQ